MAGPLRIEFPGALYHVRSRGNERRRIVNDDKDRARRVHWLRRTVETYGWHLHAWVLMNNHDHLYVETPEANLSAGMQHLNGSYTSYYNRRHRRHGHLFQGRYKAQLIENEVFVDRIRGMLGERRIDKSVPALEALRPRPSLERIAEEVAESFGTASSRWSTGRRSDDAARAVAAFVARRRFGYRATEVAKALGYASHGGVVAGVHRIESAGPGLRRMAAIP